MPLIIMAGLSIAFYVRLEKDVTYIPSALTGKQVPSVNLPALFPNATALNSTNLYSKNEITILNIFASWCVPCKAEHPYISKLATLENVRVIGLNWKDKRDSAIAFLKELGNPYSVIGFDETGLAGIDFGVYGVPETYIINTDGIIVHKRVGPIIPQVLERDILPILHDLQLQFEE